MKRKLALCIMLLFLITISTAPRQAQGVPDETIYRVLPGSDEWERLETPLAKHEACRISESVLNELSDKDLINAVVEYPFLLDIFACEDWNKAVEIMVSSSDALRELLKRKTAIAELELTIKDMVDNSEKETAVEECKKEALMIITSYCSQIRDNISENTVKLINDNSNMVRVQSDISSGTRLAYVYTPMGTPVSVTTPTCSHNNAGFHEALDKGYEALYGVTCIREGSCRYNCHSYAWYSMQPNNAVWMSNPSAYMTDGSYTELVSDYFANSSMATMGDVVVYGYISAPDHSAKLSGNGTGMLGSRSVVSKWGYAGVFLHAAYNVPSAYLAPTMLLSAWG